MRTNAVVSIPLPRVLANAFFPYAGFVVVFALLFGGGARQGLPSDAIVELVSLPLLAWAAFRLVPGRLDWLGRWALVLAAAVIALPLLQLIPMPPGLWALLPGRGRIAATYDIANMARPWLPLSLDPAATWLSLLALIPGAAVFLAMLSLDRRERRVLAGLMLVIALVSVWIGLFQILGAADLYFYAITNEDRAVGFFANANHNATFLAATIPFAAAWGIGVFTERERRPIAVLAVGVLLASLVIGVAIVGSRAGFGLGLVAGLLGAAMVYRAAPQRGRQVLPIALLGLLAAVLVFLQLGLAGWERRGVQERDVLDDLRWPVAGVTLRAAQTYLPFGTGFGTFQPIYEMSAPRAQVFDRYVNHAHNDWLELLLNGGIPALILVCSFLVWFIAVTSGAWRKSSVRGGSLDLALPRAASIAIALLLVHSIVDYPLRTTAVSTLFAIGCALLAQPNRPDPEPQHPVLSRMQ